MTIIERNDLTILTADDGMVLTNGDTVSEQVYLGKNDTAARWKEMTAEDAQELTAEEALALIVGGDG